MRNWIEHLQVPKRLILAWQAPDHMNDRFRWAVGVVVGCSAGRWRFNYLRAGEEFQSYNGGRPIEQMRALGFQGYPAFSTKILGHTDGVSQVLMRRLPPRSRQDFSTYLEKFGLVDNIDMSDFQLLAITEAKLPSDGFSLVDPLDEAQEYCDLMLEIAGFRYYSSNVPLLKAGQPVKIEREWGNPHDYYAVEVTAEQRTKIGNINRLQARTFCRWLENRSVKTSMSRLNGRLGHPKAYIFVQVRPAYLRLPV